MSASKLKLKDYVQVQLNYKPATFGRQELNIEGTITNITNETITIDHKHIIVLAHTTITVIKNVSSLDAYRK